MEKTEQPRPDSSGEDAGVEDSRDQTESESVSLVDDPEYWNNFRNYGAYASNHAGMDFGAYDEPEVLKKRVYALRNLRRDKTTQGIVAALLIGGALLVVTAMLLQA